MQEQLIKTVREHGGMASTEVLLEAVSKVNNRVLPVLKCKIKGNVKVESLETLLYVNSNLQILLVRPPLKTPLRTTER
jgi:hypothetical protein